MNFEGTGGELFVTFLVGGLLTMITAYIYLLNTVRPALATSYAYVNPPIAVLLGVLFAGEHFGALEATAMAVILILMILGSVAVFAAIGLVARALIRRSRRVELVVEPA